MGVRACLTFACRQVTSSIHQHSLASASPRHHIFLLDSRCRPADLSDTHADAIAANFAPDAQLTTPLNSVKGADNIRDVLNLHHAFASTCTPGPVNWDESNKTATFSLKSIYSLANAPWPFSMLRRFSIPVKWADVRLYLQPDESHPVRSDATEPTKYQVSRISTEARPPKNKLIAAAYSVILYTVRIVAPYFIDSLVVIHKFFVRHPLKRGVIRTGAAGVIEVLSWALRFASSKVPLIGNKTARRPQLVEDPERVATNNDVPSSPPVPPEPLPVRKSMKPKSVQEPVHGNQPVTTIDEEQIARDNAATAAEAVLDRDEAKIDEQEQAEEAKETAALESEVQKVEARAEPEAEQVKAKAEDEQKAREDAVAETTLETTQAKEEKAEDAEETKDAKVLEEEVSEVQAQGEPEPEAKTEEPKPEEPVPTFADVAAQQPAHHTTTETKENFPALAQTNNTSTEDAATQDDFPALAETVETDVDTLEQPAINPATASTYAHVAEAATSTPAEQAEPEVVKPKEAEPKDRVAEKPTAPSFAAVAAQAAEEEVAVEEEEEKPEEAKPEVEAKPEAKAKPEVEAEPEVEAKPEEPKPEEAQPEEPKVEETKPEEPAQLSFAAVAAQAAEHEEAKPEEPTHTSVADKVADQPAHGVAAEAEEDFPALPTGDNAAEEPAHAPITGLPESAPSFAEIAAPAATNDDDDDSESRSPSPPGTAEGSVAGEKKKKKASKNKKKNNRNKNKSMFE